MSTSALSWATLAVGLTRGADAAGKFKINPQTANTSRKSDANVRVGVIGLGAAIDYVESVGLDAIAAYEHELLVHAVLLGQARALEQVIGGRKAKPEEVEQRGPLGHARQARIVGVDRFNSKFHRALSRA